MLAVAGTAAGTRAGILQMLPPRGCLGFLATWQLSFKGTEKPGKGKPRRNRAETAVFYDRASELMQQYFSCLLVESKS